MNIQLIIAALIAAGSFGTAWQIQSWRADAKEKANVEQTLRATQESAKTAIRRTDNVIAAQNNAALRERILRADAAGSRSALVGLSLAAAEALSRAEATHAACLVTANTQNIVLNQCSERYRSVAEDADRAISDRQTVIDAWPK